MLGVWGGRREGAYFTIENGYYVALTMVNQHSILEVGVRRNTSTLLRLLWLKVMAAVGEGEGARPRRASSWWAGGHPRRPRAPAGTANTATHTSHPNITTRTDHSKAYGCWLVLFNVNTESLR